MLKVYRDIRNKLDLSPNPQKIQGAMQIFNNIAVEGVKLSTQVDAIVGKFHSSSNRRELNDLKGEENDPDNVACTI